MNTQFNSDASHQSPSSDNQETTTVESSESQNSTDNCLAELSLWKDQCKRISADFENFKKRTEREQARWAEIAKESLLFDLLSFVDTCEMALAQQTGDKVGIEMMHQSLLKLLAKHDVVAMKDTAEFNPEYHEGIMQVPSTDHTSGQVVQVLSKGFMLKDKVLRPAKVSVAL
ncbi:nucleotide exchange factor GrpE [Candidatus Babeliales bacterium]|nr:nucleotide exchange factor GrpE [Candidatus Babeliales bacterium]